MWDVLRWHDATLAVAWWAVVLGVFILLLLAWRAGRS